MIPVEDPLPITFQCKENEEITVTFNPVPPASLSEITRCFVRNCPEKDQKPVENNTLKFRVDKKFPLLLFFFFTDGRPLGRCDIEFTGETGEPFSEPAPPVQDITGIKPVNKVYRFVIVP